MRRRRFLILLAAFLAVVAVLVVTLPWWLGLALRATPASWGVTYARYERVGYGRFALHDAEYRRGTVLVKVSRVEADTPVLWLGRRWTGKSRDVVAQRWSVEVAPKPATAVATSAATPAPTATSVATATAASKTESGWMPLRKTLQRVAAQLDRWLPHAKIGEGVVKWPGGELALTSATWEKRTLAVQALSLRALHANVSLEFPAGTDELRLAAQTVDGAGAITLKNPGAAVAADVTWWEQRGMLTGKFGANGWLPTEASLQADAWSVPGNKVKLGDLYATVRGRGRIDWSEQRFKADVAVTGEPVAGKKAPPLEVELRGQGDPQAFTVEKLHAALPGITADLSAPVTVDRSGKFSGSGATFAVKADLAKQPWFTATGAIEGEARLAAGVAQAPVVDFKVLARDVTADDFGVASAEANGRFEWPRIQVAAFSLVGKGGEKLQGRGGWNFREKEIVDAAVEGEVRRATFARWLPAQPQFDAVTIKARAAGPLVAANHAGEANARGVTFPGVKPLTVVASWNGRGATLDKITAEATAAKTRLTVTGAVEADALRLTAIDLTQGNEPRLKLTQPATVSWRPTLHIEALRLAGPEASLDADVTWGATGSAAIAMRNVPSAWLSDLVDLPGPAWTMTSVAVTGSWDRGPMTFSAVLGASFELGEGRRAVVNLAGRGDKDGVRLEALRAAEGAASIVNATGAFAAVFTPGAKTLMTIDERAPLVIDADTAPNAAFWQELAALTGLELKEPHVAVHLKGTWQRPEGDVRLKVERIAADPKRFKRPLPTIESLDAALVGDRAGVRLDTFVFKVEGQEVKASGRLPIPEADWPKTFKEPLAFARRGADLHFEIPDAEVAVFARFLPTYLAPKGRLHVDMNYKAGAFDGNLRLTDAATRPLGPLGILQEIQADVRLAGNAIEIRSVTAKSGGEEVRLTGRVELPEWKAGQATVAGGGTAPVALPKFDVALKGDNLPFVRRSGLLMRGDLDLKLTTPERGAPRLSGKVKLRDSLFLQDVRALRPSGTHSVSRRPPYFSIETPPLDTWRLDVTVEGEEFMRMRTTLFAGVASARFHLGGTLAEPVAIGEATVDEGRVRLPFASFDVQEGRVILSREQPYEPQLSVVATTRRFNYDLRMEVTGTADAPVLAFSSSPPLEHGQILLMVTAGETPQSDVTFSDRARAQRLGMFIGQSLFASFGDDSAAERVTLTSGEKVSRAGKETLEAEVRLTKRWSVTAEYPDEFDEKNVGVKVRVYTKGGRDEAVAGKSHESDQK